MCAETPLRVYQNFDIIDITFQNDQSQYIIPVVANPVEYYSPPTVTPEDVYDKLGISKNDVNYTALIILAISVVVIISVTPKISAFLGRVFGGPVDKALRRNRNRRR